jgi:hypothetical protein
MDDTSRTMDSTNTRPAQIRAAEIVKHSSYFSCEAFFFAFLSESLNEKLSMK